MGVSFFETMRGSLRDHAGRSHPVDFEIKAEATHLGRLARCGELRISGVVRARPWADDAVLDGSLRVSPLARGELVYDFGFHDAEDRVYRFLGRKTLVWHRLLHSMTHLDGELSQEGKRVARGTLTFDLRELPDLATSLSAGTSMRRLPLHALPGEVPGLPLLDEHELATLNALAEAIVEPGVFVPAVDDETIRSAVDMLRQLPAQVGACRILRAAAAGRR